MCAARRRVAVVVNPTAGSGRGARMLTRLRTAFPDSDIRVSQHAGHEHALVTAALADGCDTIVAVGGDGTIAHAANAILQHGGTARLLPVAAGTGNDFVRNAAYARSLRRGDLRAAARAAFGHAERRIDVGQVEDTYFLNSCGFGFDVAVLDSMARARARHTTLRGPLLYISSAITELRGYRGVTAAVGDSPRFTRLLIVVANGARFGGAFRIAPRAVMTDGLLDLIELWQTRSLWRRVQLLFAAMRGRHLGAHDVRATQIPVARITFDAPPVCQTDGERRQLDSATVTIRTIPGALLLAELPS